MVRRQAIGQLRSVALWLVLAVFSSRELAAQSGTSTIAGLVTDALGARRPLLNAVLGGWRIGVLETVMSGPPFTVITSANTTNAFPAGPLRPNLVGDPSLPDDQETLMRWFNTSAFVSPAPFAFGNSPRSVLRGPGIRTTDTTLEKAVAVTGGTRVDLRVEAFNLLNHTNFGIPGFTLDAADFGVISSARPARTIQLGARVSC